MRSLWRRLVLLFGRERALRELEEEMRLHRQLREEALQAGGLEAGIARRRAGARFGDALRHADHSRDAWGLRLLDEFGQDVRYATRRLRQRPGFTFSVIAVLALGTGATTAMFSAVDAALLRPFPFQRPDELVAVDVNVPFRTDPGQPAPGGAVHVPDLSDVAGMQETFSGVAAYAVGGINLADPDRPLRLKAGVVTGNLFQLLGMRPYLGRAFSREEVQPGGPDVAVLSWGLWQNHLGGGDVVGRTIRLNNRAFEVVGVMPRGFTFPEQSDVWIPMTVPATPRTFESFRGYLPSTVLARLAPGVTVEHASSRVLAAFSDAIAAYPDDPRWARTGQEQLARLQRTGAARPLREVLVRVQQRALLVLLGITGILLLITYANVTNLLLAQGAARRRELTVRGVLGASRARVLHQLLVESVMLSCSGAALGVVLAPVILRGLHVLMPPALAGIAPAQLDLRVLGFAALTALVIGTGFGLVPALRALRGTAAVALKEGGGHGGSAAGAGRLQRLFVGAELALTVMLLVAAGLMLRSLERLTSTDIGIDATQVATLELSLARDSATAAAVRYARVDAMLERLRAVPGITAAGLINDLPLRGGGGISLSLTSEDAVESARDGFARLLIVSEDYFRAIGVRLERGRFFTPADDHAAPRVVIVNERLASTYWPGREAVGRRLQLPGSFDWFTVIGVVANVREHAIEEEPLLQLFLPARTNMGMNAAIVARGSLPPTALLRALTQSVHAVDPTQAVYNVRMMDEVVDASVAARRTLTRLISLFGALALLVSLLGTYAVTAQTVARRTREFGIRAALGATGQQLIGQISRELVWVAVAGVALGSWLAWLFARVLQNLLYDVTVHDAVTFLTAPAALTTAVLVATLVPAYRVLRVNPAEVIRSE